MRNATRTQPCWRIVAALVSFAAWTEARADVEAAAIRIHAAPLIGDHFGLGAAAVGDVDGDGSRDYAIADVGVALGYAALYSGANGSLLRTIPGGPSTDLFGFAMIDLGDIDLDGFDDLAISAPGTSIASDFEFTGKVTAFSGATGAPLWTLSGQSQSELCGLAMEQMGDLDGDGFVDLAIGSPGWRPGYNMFSFGRVRLISGASGATIGQWLSSIGNSESGRALAPIDDLNGDDIPELVVGRPGLAEAVILNGASLEPLASVTGDANSRFGCAIARLDDADGDGLADFIVGASDYRQDGDRLGRVAMYSSATLEMLWERTGTRGSSFGERIISGPDLDADGRHDVIVGASGFRIANLRVGRVQVHAAHDGQTIMALSGTPSVRAVGYAMAHLGDVNADGIDDLLLGAEASKLGVVISVEQAPSGAFTAINSATGSIPPGFTRCGDLNGDGVPDLAVIDALHDAIVIAINDGYGRFEEQTSVRIGRRPSDLALADLDHDGDLDMAVALRNEGAVAIVRNDHGQMRRSGKIDVGRQPIAVVAANLDDDHMPDLAVAYARGGPITIWRNSGTGWGPLQRRFRQVAELPIAFEVTQLISTRLNQAGPRDLLGIAPATGQVAAFMNRGHFRFNLGRLTVLNSEHLPMTSLIVGDFDGDGIRDLATADNISTTPLIHLGRGNGLFLPGNPTLPTPGPIRSLAAADLDDNGTDDLFCGDAGLSMVHAIFMPSAGSAIDPILHSHATGAAPRWMVTSDIDGDLDFDAVVVSEEGAMTVLYNAWLD